MQNNDNGALGIAFVSPYNTETTKYHGPLAVVTYEGSRNGENQMHGEGQVLFANGSTYVGGFSHDMLNGYGVLTDEATGTVYSGHFKDDMRDGVAVFTYPGGTYEGEYVNNKRHGQGKETDDAGNVFIGQFENGDFVLGKIFYENGDIYVGACKDDCRHGRGKLLRLEDGVELDGTWIEDEFQG